MDYIFNPYFETKPLIKEAIVDYDNHVRNVYIKDLLNQINELQNQINTLSNQLNYYRNNERNNNNT